jgi:hypothetical protein
MVINELDRVVLTAAVPAEGLEPGDVGTVVHTYSDGRAFEVEFTTLDGETAAVVTVEASNVRPVGRREITHARELAAR